MARDLAYQAYLDDCEKHCIVPDKTGAFVFAWEAAKAQRHQTHDDTAWFNSVRNVKACIKAHHQHCIELAIDWDDEYLDFLFAKLLPPSVPSQPGVAIPYGYAVVPIEAYAENGMKAQFIGEYKILVEEVWYTEEGERVQKERLVNIDWTMLKQIYRDMVAFAALPQPAKGEE
jgi:hypothetical protein